MKNIGMPHEHPARRADDVGASFRYAPLNSHIVLWIVFKFYELYLSKNLDGSTELSKDFALTHS